jgi:hypothetical protein
MRRDIAEAKKGKHSMRYTISDVGYGAVLASRRKMTSEEKAYRIADRNARRAAGDTRARVRRHIEGWDVANFLASKGHDPYKYRLHHTRFAAEFVEE